MRIDRYTKIGLTILVLLLAVIALKPLFQPQLTNAAGQYAGVQFSYSNGEPTFFDTNSGDVWIHDNNGHFKQHYKVGAWGHDLGR
jgi:hypothetical protein